MLALLTAVLITQAWGAPTCNVSAVKAELATASPTSVPKVWMGLAACDAAAAKATADSAFSRMIPGDDANAAAAQAMALGASDAVVAWVGKLQSDERSATISWLGGQCKGNASVEGFFIETQGKLGQQFFEQRWFRGLADCRTPAIQAMLQRVVDEQAAPKPNKNHTQFAALVEVYARNLGGAAVPTLGQLVRNATDPAEATPLISTFADAANIGSAQGTDVDAAAKAVAELQELVPSLPPASVDQARATLVALGADEIASGIATYRWPERKDGSNYRYAAVVAEYVTCKNAKKKAFIHSGVFLEAGGHWPDEIQAGLQQQLEPVWKLDAAARCKGAGTVQLEMSPEPLPDDAALRTWVDQRTKELDVKATVYGYSVDFVEHEDLQLP